MSVMSILRRMRATAVLLEAARSVDRKHPVLRLKYEVENVPIWQMVTWRRQTAESCLCLTCHRYLNAVAAYDRLFAEANPDVVTELPNPSKENQQ